MENKEINNFNELTEDIIKYNIMVFLEIEEIRIFCRTEKKHVKLYDDELLWRNLLERDYGCKKTDKYKEGLEIFWEIMEDEEDEIEKKIIMEFSRINQDVYKKIRDIYEETIQRLKNWKQDLNEDEIDFFICKGRNFVETVINDNNIFMDIFSEHILETVRHEPNLLKRGIIKSCNNYKELYLLFQKYNRNTIIKILKNFKKEVE